MAVCRYVANMSYCQFPLLAAGLAQAGISCFRFDHAMAINRESERKGPFLMGNHDDEVRGALCGVLQGGWLLARVLGPWAGFK